MTGWQPRHWVPRLLASLAVGAGTGLLAAIALTIVDLYLSGHGHRALGAPLLDWPGLGVHLSLADILFLASVVLGAVLAWRRGSANGP